MSTRQKKILVIDDAADFTLMMDLVIQSFDYEPIITSNGLEGLKKLEMESCDLVLLDLMMPEMDGFEVLKRIKTDAKYKKVPVIIVTAMADTSAIKDVFLLGADDYMIKPFDPTVLKKRIDHLLGWNGVRLPL